MATAAVPSAAALPATSADGVMVVANTVDCVGSRAVLTLQFVNTTSTAAKGSYAVTAPDATPTTTAGVDVPPSVDIAQPMTVTTTAPRGAFRVWDTTQQAASYPSEMLYIRDCARGYAFTDIWPGLQFAPEMDWMAWQGISTGYGDGTYRPWEPIRRDAMAAFLYRLAGRPAFTAPSRPRFSDVPPSNQFYREIEWLASTGITTGYTDGTYRPLAPVNRDAMAAFLFRMGERAGQGPYPALKRPPFTDVGQDNQFYREISWMYDAGLSTAYPDGSYRPVTPISRDAMAAFLFRYVNLMTVPV